MKILGLVSKNLKLLLRSKTSALIIFIGPLLLVCLLGLAYSQSNTYTLTASVFSESYSPLSENLIEKMINQNFQVLRQANLEDCINSVKRSESHTCIVFPPNMNPTQQNTVTFYVDYSKINLLWVIVDALETRVSEKSEEISSDRTKDLLERVSKLRFELDQTNTKLNNLKDTTSKIKGKTQGAQEGVASFDVNVTLDVNLNDAKKGTDDVLLTFSDIKTDIDDAIVNVRESLDTIDTKVGAIENQVSENISEELESIQTALGNAEDDLSQLDNGFYNNNLELTEKVGDIKTSLNSLNTAIGEAQSKMDGVEHQRDSILPVFKELQQQADTLNAQIEEVEKSIEDAKSKILGVSVNQVGDIVAPIQSKIKPVTAQKTHYNSLFPGLLVLIIMITAVLLGSALIIGEKKSKAFFRNNLVPTSFAVFTISNYLTALLVIAVQLILFVSVSAFFFETEIIASIWLLLLLVLLVTTLFIVVGMFIGFLFKTEATSTLASITAVSIFLLFSNTVMPIEAMTGMMKKVASFNPFVISETAIRQSMLYNLGFTELWRSIALLAGYALGVFVLLLLLQEALRKMSFRHHSKPAIVKEKKAEKKLVPEIPKVENAANELLVKKEDSDSGKKDKK